MSISTHKPVTHRACEALKTIPGAATLALQTWLPHSHSAVPHGGETGGYGLILGRDDLLSIQARLFVRSTVEEAAAAPEQRARRSQPSHPLTLPGYRMPYEGSGIWIPARRGSPPHSTLIHLHCRRRRIIPVPAASLLPHSDGGRRMCYQSGDWKYTGEGGN